MCWTVSSFLERIRTYLRVTQAGGIARRYFVLNGFDGAMTALGIILGSWIAGVVKSETVILTGLGACLAMALSGFSGAYLAEKAERERCLKILERKTKNHVAPIQYEASRFVEFYVAFIDAFSPILTVTIALTPFFFASREIISLRSAYLSSTVLSLITLFLFGVYLGRTAKRNGLLYGLSTLAVGILTAVLILLFQSLYL